MKLFLLTIVVALLAGLHEHFEFIVISYVGPAISQNCSTHGEVRLFWGAGDWEGNVQVCIDGVWGWVCHNGFSSVDAQIVCHQLGFAASG